MEFNIKLNLIKYLLCSLNPKSFLLAISLVMNSSYNKKYYYTIYIKFTSLYWEQNKKANFRFSIMKLAFIYSFIILWINPTEQEYISDISLIVLPCILYIFIISFSWSENLAFLPAPRSLCIFYPISPYYFLILCFHFLIFEPH